MADKKEKPEVGEVKKEEVAEKKPASSAKTATTKSTAAKPAAKTAASKSTAAKSATKTTESKSAEKKPTAAKPAAKTTATAKSAAKPAAKTTAAKSMAAKPAAKTTAAKSTAAKPAAKSVTKSSAKKPAAAKPDEVKPVAEPEIVEEIKPVAQPETVEEVKPVAETPAPEAIVPDTVQPEQPVLPVTEVKEEPAKQTIMQKTAGAFKTAGAKTKAACVSAASTVKGWFVKGKPVEATVSEGDVNAEMKTVLSGSNLSTKERIIRFCRSQTGWLFVLPAVVLMCIFTLYPIFNAFIRAFMENYMPTNKAHPFDGWGFENFVRVLKGDTGMGGANFWQCLLNTFIVTIISVPLSILIALLIAVALSSIKAVRKAYQTILFLPYLTNALAMGAVFATFFQIIGTKSNTETIGMVNNFLGWFGISPIDWLNPNMHAWGSGTVKVYWASYLVAIIYDVWAGLPFKILILFSALQSVNKQYYDAAKIDGASRSKVLWKITAPMISPMLSYLFITGIMGGMKSYSSIVGLFGEQMGRDFNMGTVVGYIYQYIDKGQTGYAFAGSLLLFVIIMIITAISNYVSKKRVTYT